MAFTLPVPRSSHTTLTALVVLLLTALLTHLYRRAFRRRPYPGIPYNSPATRALWGDLPSLIAEAQARRDPSQATHPHFQRHRSPVVQLFLAPFWKPLIYLHDTREVDDALANRTTTHFAKSWTTAAPFRPVVPGSSICKVKGPEWIAQVRLWSDVISLAFLRDVAAPTMHAAALDLAALFRAKAAVGHGRPFWAHEDYKIATFDVIWKTMLGADLHGLRYERDAVNESTTAATDGDSLDAPASFASAPKSDEWNAAAYFASVIPKFVMFPVPAVAAFFFSLTPTWRTHWATKKRFMAELLADSRARFADLGEGVDESVAEKRDVCALDRALRRFAKVAPGDVYRPSVDDMYDELMMLLVSGYETTASLLSWAAKFLGQNQAEQAELRAALRTHFPLTQGKTPDVKAIISADIPYLEASIEELIRVANVIPEVVREAAVDTDLLGRRIPKGATVVFSLKVSNKPFGPDVVPDETRSETSRANKGGYRTFWEEDMDAYHPERWLREDGSFDAKALPKLAFSVGPRSCFGRKFAAQQFRIMLVVLVLNFEFLPVPDELNSNDAYTSLTRSPCQCFSRMKPI